MSLVIRQSRLCNLRLYKFDMPSETDVGVLIRSTSFGHTLQRFQLTRYTGRRSSKSGLSNSFEDMVDCCLPHETNIYNQFSDYIGSNFSFKDLDIVPPACPVLVIYFQTRWFGQNHVPVIDITNLVLIALRLGRDPVMSVVDARTRPVPIAPPTTEILDSYQSSEMCSLCEKGYPKEDEIVHRTKCNHIFHGTCISRYLLHTPRCPVCSVELPPVDIRTLLFI